MDQAMKEPPLTFGRIVRNEAGEIVRVEMNEDNLSPSAEPHTPSIDSDTLSKWAASGGTSESLGTEGAIVKGEC
jgi:nucleolar protein 16